jgi:hypothetical protein
MSSHHVKRCTSKVKLFLLVAASRPLHTTIVGQQNLYHYDELCFQTEFSRRKHRRIASTWLSQKAVDAYSPILDRESRSLIKALYDEGNHGNTPINPQVRFTAL